MNMENHLVLYQAGHAGTFLVWLINQHKNFPQYDFQWKYTDAGVRLDLGCYGADWNYQTQLFSESRNKSKMSDDRQPRNSNRTKDAIKLLPNHCCQLNGEVGTIDRRLLKEITDQVQPKSIILPVISDNSLYLRDELLNRWIAYCKQNNKIEIDRDVWKYWWFKDHFPLLMENLSRFGDNAHTIDIGKIIMNVKSEYTKLCEIINEEPLVNLNELTIPIRTMLKENYKTVHN